MVLNFNWTSSNDDMQRATETTATQWQSSRIFSQWNEVRCYVRIVVNSQRPNVWQMETVAAAILVTHLMHFSDHFISFRLQRHVFSRISLSLCGKDKSIRPSRCHVFISSRCQTWMRFPHECSNKYVFFTIIIWTMMVEYGPNGREKRETTLKINKCLGR